ncbi:unnamed protein product (plasmid) [Mycetohabitans rhizoxinica HKI 454]|uniref:Uncharacterized protein n=2 Tax=Burkholderiaceae TaxID=119060 RepID=E5AUV1_MYCRK|nr:unnamed protein product [Mycetohabitans rhizoxinica HKI 454]
MLNRCALHFRQVRCLYLTVQLVRLPMQVNTISPGSAQVDSLSFHNELNTGSEVAGQRQARAGSKPEGVLAELPALACRTSMARRRNVTSQAACFAQHPEAKYYPPVVQQISGLLEKQNIGISDRAHDGVIANMEGLRSGTQTHTGAHLVESRVFGRDAIEHFKSGETYLAVVNCVGSLINGVASMTVGPAHDFDDARRSSDPQRAARAYASIAWDFETLPSPTPRD